MNQFQALKLPYSGKFSRGSIFADGRSCNISQFDFHGYTQSCHYIYVQMCLFRGLIFVVLIFAVHEPTVKTTKIGPSRIFRCMIFNYFPVQEEAEVKSDGTHTTLKPSQHSVARITVIRG